MNELQNTADIDFSNTTDLVLNTQAMDSAMKLAEFMASGKAALPEHLQGNPSDCFAIVLQAAQWRMNPFAVAQKTHLINGNMGYEAQLVNAVVTSSKSIEGAFEYVWFGPWEKVIGKFVTKTNAKGQSYKTPGWTPQDEEGCGIRISAKLVGESEPRELELLLSQAQTRNSTLWASDPKQQLAYLAIKRWTRLYLPAVLMGVYTPDELEEPTVVERELNPISSAPSQQSVSNVPDEQTTPDDEPPLLPEFTREMLDQKRVGWTKNIQAGYDPDEIISNLVSRYSVTEELANEIRNLGK